MDNSLLKTLQNVKLTSHIKRCSDDDFVDRVNNFYTPLILVIFTIVICTKSYIVGEPLQCWVPIHFSKGWEKYSESWCYIKNTYYVPPAKQLPNEEIVRKQSELQYYQWVPFVMGLQAVLFVLPSFFWKLFSWQAKLHLKPLIQRGVKSSFEIGDKRKQTLKSISDHIRNCLFKPSFLYNVKTNALQRSEKNRCCSLVNIGSYLTLCYIITKILYIANIICQFFIVHTFLKTNFFFGFDLLSKLTNGTDWQETGLFPRVTMCDFVVPRIGQLLSHTMQCVLVINLFNEKIYIFLWFWLAFLFVITTLSLLVWITKMLFGRNLSSFISAKSNYRTNSDDNSIFGLCQSEITCDGYFALRLIETNCGIITTRRITENILDYYKTLTTPEKYSSLPPNYLDLENPNKNITDFI